MASFIVPDFFFNSWVPVLYFDLRPGPKMLFQGDTPEVSDTFQWPVIERDRVGGLRLIIWDKVKVPLCHYSDAPEESYLWTAWQLFPLDDDLTFDFIDPVGDRVGVELLYNWVELIRCHKESQHLAVDPKTSGWASKRTRKTQRDGHNSGVKIWSLCSVSRTLSDANLEQPFRTLAIKWEVNMFVKEVFLCLPSCVFIVVSLWIILHIYVHVCRCESTYVTI